MVATFSLALCINHVCAQDVQWAGKVITASSSGKMKNNPGVYAPEQALGSPSMMPGTGFHPCAWAPGKQDGDREVLQVGYKKAQYAQQLIVHESNCPGAIWVIDLIDPKGEAHRVYEKDTIQPHPEVNGKFTYFRFPRTSFYIASVRLVLKTGEVPGHNQIDAVGIADNLDSVTVKVNYDPSIQVNGKPEPLGPGVNSEYEELQPVITPDGRKLYFVRKGHPGNVKFLDNQDIWWSVRKPDGDFAEGQWAGSTLNTYGENALLSLTPDGLTALLMNEYRENGWTAFGISSSSMVMGKWTKPVKVQVNDLYNKAETCEFQMDADGKRILMTLQRLDSYGNKDIYVSFRETDTSWSAPMNLGPIVNTAAGEVSPFLAADGKTLYYSTSGFPTFGKNDMFMTRRLDSTWTNWTEPVNLGPVLNSPEWDAYYSLPAAGDLAYFVSYKSGKGDIYRIPLPDALRPDPVVLVKGKVLDQKTGKPVAANIIYEDLATGKVVGQANSDGRDGSYSIILAAGVQYGFVAEASGYAAVSENLSFPKLETYQEMVKNLRVVPLEKGQIIRMNNIFFDPGSAQLKSLSFPELRRIQQLLDEQPGMRIEICGHTDSDGPDAANLELSRRRAESVMQYLLKAGVPKERLQSRGYGETSPVAPNDSAENKQLNRRVEFTILEL